MALDIRPISRILSGYHMPRTTGTLKTPDRIAHAAIALFSRQGYHGTSTCEIARLADVSEVTVFRYFEHKEDIFLSALNSSFSVIQPRLNLLDRSIERRRPEEVLSGILSLLVDIAIYSPELMRLVASAFLEVRGKAEEVCYGHLTPLFTAITNYLISNMENGKLQGLNPRIVTAAMALTAIAQPELSNLIGGGRASQLSGRELVEEYLAFWLKVLVPPITELGA